MCCNLQASCGSTFAVDHVAGNEFNAAPDLDTERVDDGHIDCVDDKAGQSTVETDSHHALQGSRDEIRADIFPAFPPQVEMYTREFVNQLGASNLIQMPIHLECTQNSGLLKKWTPQHASLFDIGATTSFIRSTLVDKYKWPIMIAPATVTNGDGSKSISPGVVRAKIRIGAFIKTVLLRVASLCKFDVIIGKDLIDECKIEVEIQFVFH